MPEETSFKLLIVEDDPGIATMLKAFFAPKVPNFKIAPDGQQGLELISSFHPDIIILDIVLPYVDGLSVLDIIRSNNIQTPVILLTDKRTIEEKLRGFEHGADDYVTKPFSPKELWMRVQSIIRRTKTMESTERQPTITIGNLSINPVAREVKLSNKKLLSLTKTEFDIIYFLAKRKDQAVPHTVILEKVMGYSPTSETKALVIHIANIRKKLGSKSLHSIKLLAVPGVGYKITERQV